MNQAITVKPALRLDREKHAPTWDGDEGSFQAAGPGTACTAGSLSIFAGSVARQSVGQVAGTNIVYILFVRLDQVGRLANLGMSAILFGSAGGAILGAYLIGFGATALRWATLALSTVGWLCVAYCERAARRTMSPADAGITILAMPFAE